MHGHHREADANQLMKWRFEPAPPKESIARKPLPMYLNLPYVQGRAPTEAKCT